MTFFLRIFFHAFLCVFICIRLVTPTNTNMSIYGMGHVRNRRTFYLCVFVSLSLPLSIRNLSHSLYACQSAFVLECGFVRGLSVRVILSVMEISNTTPFEKKSLSHFLSLRIYLSIPKTLCSYGVSSPQIYPLPPFPPC